MNFLKLSGILAITGFSTYAATPSYKILTATEVTNYVESVLGTSTVPDLTNFVNHFSVDTDGLLSGGDIDILEAVFGIANITNANVTNLVSESASISGTLTVSNIVADTINRSAVFPSGTYGDLVTGDDGETFNLVSTFSVGDITGAGTNTVASAFDDLRLRRSPKYYNSYQTGGVFTVDWNAQVSGKFYVSTNVTIEDSNRPTNTDLTIRGSFQLINNTTNDYDVESIGDWVYVSEIPLTMVPANSKVECQYGWDGDEVRLSYESPEPVTQPISRGGTANDKGVADSPDWTVQSSGATDSTNHSIAFGQGTVQLINMTANVNFTGSSGRTTNSQEVKIQDVIMINKSGGNLTNTWTTSWDSVGATQPFTVSNNTKHIVRFYSHTADYETNVFFVKLGGDSVTTTGGGGEPTISYPTNGLIAYWPMEDASANTIVDTWATYDMTGVVPARFTAQVSGINNYAITNTGSSGTYANALSVSSTDLKPGASGERSYSQWVYVGAHKSYNVVVAHWNDGTTPACAFLGYLGSSGQVLWRYGYLGPDPGTGSWDTGLTVGTGAWHFLYFGVDHVNNDVFVSVDGGTIVSKTDFSSDFYNHTSPITYFNSLYNGSPQSTHHFTGKMDEIAVHDRLLTQEELEQIYNSGAGRFYEP